MIVIRGLKLCQFIADVFDIKTEYTCCCCFFVFLKRQKLFKQQSHLTDSVRSLTHFVLHLFFVLNVTVEEHQVCLWKAFIKQATFKGLQVQSPVMFNSANV